jgi:hypothetical protein
LAKAEVGDDVMLAYIANEKAPFNLSSDDIIDLKTVHVSAAVLIAMLNHDAKTASPSPVNPVQVQPLVLAPEIYEYPDPYPYVYPAPYPYYWNRHPWGWHEGWHRPFR